MKSNLHIYLQGFKFNLEKKNFNIKKNRDTRVKEDKTDKNHKKR